MAIRDVMVYLDRSPHAAARLQLAAKLAAGLGATLAGLRVEVHMEVPQAFRAAIRAELLEIPAQAIRDDTKRIEADLRAAADVADVACEWWARESGGVEEVVRSARYADLTVVGLPPKDHDEELPADDLIHALLFGSGRPVLVVPDPAPAAAPGRHVAVAWNASRESSRAVADSLSLLQKADKVSVVTVCRGDDRAKLDDLADAVRHLIRNGVKAEALHVEGGDRRAGEALVGAATAAGADLLVMGAYGQSRMREMVLGGATWNILHRAAMPVLMSH